MSKIFKSSVLSYLSLIVGIVGIVGSDALEHGSSRSSRSSLALVESHAWESGKLWLWSYQFDAFSLPCFLAGLTVPRLGQKSFPTESIALISIVMCHSHSQSFHSFTLFLANIPRYCLYIPHDSLDYGIMGGCNFDRFVDNLVTVVTGCFFFFYVVLGFSILIFFDRWKMVEICHRSEVGVLLTVTAFGFLTDRLSFPAVTWRVVP